MGYVWLIGMRRKRWGEGDEGDKGEKEDGRGCSEGERMVKNEPDS